MKLEFNNTKAVLTIERKPEALPGSAPLIRKIEVPVDKFTTALYSLGADPRANRDLSPSSIRFISENGTKIVFERPPCTVRVSFRPGKPYLGKTRAKLENFELNLPWQLYCIDLETGQILPIFARNSLSSMDQSTFVLPLPNGDLSFSNSSCLGSHQHDEWNKLKLNGSSKKTLINTAISSFWMNEFNDDISIRLSALPLSLQELPYTQKAIRAHNPTASSISSSSIITSLTHSFSLPGKVIFKLLSNLSVDELCALNWYEQPFRDHLSRFGCLNPAFPELDPASFYRLIESLFIKANQPSYSTPTISSTSLLLDQPDLTVEPIAAEADNGFAHASRLLQELQAISSPNQAGLPLIGTVIIAGAQTTTLPNPPYFEYQTYEWGGVAGDIEGDGIVIQHRAQIDPPSEDEYVGMIRMGSVEDDSIELEIVYTDDDQDDNYEQESF